MEPGRVRHHHSIRVDDADRLPSDVDLDTEHSSLARVVEHDFVEPDPLATAREPG